MAETQSTLFLVRSAQSGDDAALVALFDRYRDRLRRWASGRVPRGLRGRLDTEDVVHDALVGTFKQLHRLDPQGGGAFQAYTRRAVQNAIAAAVRKKAEDRLDTMAEDRASDPDPSPLEELLGREELDRYDAALATLDDEEREAVVARLECHCSWEEIAEEFDKPSPDAARMMVKRAVKKIARELRRG